MKSHKFISLSAVLLLIIAVTNNCKKVTGRLDDQSPLLIVNIELNDPGNVITIDDTYKVYLIYYADNDWTNPWLTQSTTTRSIINPVVGTFSTYIAVFWDHQAGVPIPSTDGNGVPDAGEPCTGFENWSHSGSITPGTPDPLTPLNFIPLEWRMVTITLDPGRVF